MNRHELITQLSNEIKAIIRNDLSYFVCGDIIKSVSEIRVWFDDESCIGFSETIAFSGEVELWLAVPYNDTDLKSQRYSISGTAIVKDYEVAIVNKPLSIKKQ